MTMEVALLGTSTDDPSYNNDSRVKRLVQIEGQLLALQRIWDTGTLAYRSVTDSDLGGGGGGGGDATAANQVTGNTTLSSIETGVATHRMKVLAANDVQCARTWYDEGTSTMRPNTFVYSSASVGGASHTRTFTWRLVTGIYVLDDDDWS